MYAGPEAGASSPHGQHRPPSDPTKLKIQNLYLYDTFYIAVSIMGDIQ